MTVGARAVGGKLLGHYCDRLPGTSCLHKAINLGQCSSVIQRRTAGGAFAAQDGGRMTDCRRGAVRSSAVERPERERNETDSYQGHIDSD